MFLNLTQNLNFFMKSSFLLVLAFITKHTCILLSCNSTLFSKRRKQLEITVFVKFNLMFMVQ